MPKPGGRGGKRSHKGQKRHFTSEDEIRAQQVKEEKEKAWRKQQGIESDESGEEEEGAKKKSTSTGAPGELPPSSSEEESSDEEVEEKPKGVGHLIEVSNPNRAAGRQTKKITELSTESATTQLSRREREELAKQQAAARYRKLHEEGKTEQAQADLARLALIRKQRDEAAKRREEELKAKAAKEAQKKK